MLFYTEISMFAQPYFRKTKYYYLRFYIRLKVDVFEGLFLEKSFFSVFTRVFVFGYYFCSRLFGRVKNSDFMRACYKGSYGEEHD